MAAQALRPFPKRYENASVLGRRGALATGAGMPTHATRQVVTFAGPLSAYAVAGTTALLVGLSWSLGRIYTFGIKVFLTDTAIRVRTPGPYGNQVEIR